MKKIILKTEYSRQFPDPLNKENIKGIQNIQHYIFLCKANTLPTDIPTDINPRSQDTDKAVYREVKDSLLTKSDPTFHLKNKGITILANSVNISSDKQSAEILLEDEENGIVDGAHTYKIILENMTECPDNQFVKIEVVTAIPGDFIESIAQGLNTAVQVQRMSLANLAGEFKWIEDILKDMPYSNDIAYKENEEGSFDIRDIVSILTLFNIDEYPEGSNKYPRIAYSSKAACLELYLSKKDSYKKLKPLLKDILYLHDYVQTKGGDVYNKKYGGKAGRLAFFDTRQRGEHTFVFTGEKGKSKLYDGALYPILGAFRYLVEKKPDSNVFSWKVDSFEDVKKVFSEVGADLINSTKNTSDTRGKNPNAIGKDENHWDNLYKTVALAYLQKVVR